MKLFLTDNKLTLPLTGATRVAAVEVENAATIVIGKTTNKSLVSVNFELL
jgi:hypothetical protein